MYEKIRQRARQLKEAYGLRRHPEGGWFAEDYTCGETAGGRPLMGSIYFLLDGEEISHFHRIDCDELWYYHEGCGLLITVLHEGKKRELVLGADPTLGQKMEVRIPKGAIFAAENLNWSKYTFLSCATAPRFRYEGFHLVSGEELARDWPEICADVSYLAAKP